jgi:uncharacterized protein YjiS (DUF1127 family)
MAITHPHTAETSPVALLARAVATVNAILKLFGKRKDFSRLREMSDHELADIGLQRSDIHDAWSRRTDVEPTRYLDALARSRGLEDMARRVS